MLRRAATQLTAASSRAAASAASGSCSSGVGGVGALSMTTSTTSSSAGIASIAVAARSFASSAGTAAAAAATKNASSSSSSSALGAARVRPLPTLAWAAATALATTTLLSPSGGAAKAEEAAAAKASAAAAASASSSNNSNNTNDLYSLPRETTGLFSSSSSPSTTIQPLTLYQYEVCPFCCKVKAVLDYYGVPYRVVEVSPLTKRQLKWGEHRKVPVLALGAMESNEGNTSSSSFSPAPGVPVLADSSAIISRIAAEAEAAGLKKKRKNEEKNSSSSSSSSSSSRWWWRRSSSSSSSKSTDKDSDSSPHSSREAIWRKWVDGRLVKVITVNIYRTGKEAWQTFDYISETGDFGGPLEKAAARVVGAGMMWAIAGRLAKKYGVEGEPRDALEHAGKEWTEGALRKSSDDDGDESSSSSSSSSHYQPFAGGDEPDLSDLSAFGVWRAVAKTDSFEDAMRGNGRLREWYGRMERAVGPSARVE